MVNYRVGKCIGSGSYGKVFIVRNYAGDSYAMKRISTYSISNKEKKQLINEIRILKYSNCPYLIKLVECKANLTNIEIVTNYARFGDLLSIITRRKKRYPVKQFQEQLVWSYFIQVCYGIEYLHNNNIIHRDLKCGNVFLDRGDRIFIGDFGTTKVFLDGNKLTGSSIGTPYYMSPEVISKQKYDKSADLWGLGCFLFEIITFYPPFTGRNFQHLTTKIKSKKFSVDITKFKTTYSRELLVLPEQILRFYQSIAVYNILKLKEVAKNSYLIPYLTSSNVNITNMHHKFQDISIASWYTICNNINRES
jgi:serine/threonine protein kinase